jgi:hypothetical protein
MAVMSALRIGRIGNESRLFENYTHALAFIRTSCKRVFEKLMVARLLNKFTAPYETKTFITVFTVSFHWSVFWVT